MERRSYYFFGAFPNAPLVPWLERTVTGASVTELKGVPNPFSEVHHAVSLETAEAAFIPNNFRTKSRDVAAYVTACADAAEAAGKPLFIFSCGDLSDRVRFDPRVYVLRQSLYRSTMHPQDISIPTLTEDAAPKAVEVRKKDQAPTISFCGQAGYVTKKQWLSYGLKVFLHLVGGIVSKNTRARTIGVYWRRRAIAACRRSHLVQTNFILRRSFSGAERTIELDPAQARSEFIATLKETDFVLTPKGDGNYSNRFLEALSFGRIPVLIDTEYVLSLEREIDYDEIMVRVPMEKMDELPMRVSAWYSRLTDHEWELRQRRAREIFETRLRFDAFFSHFFTEVLPMLPPDARSFRP